MTISPILFWLLVVLAIPGLAVAFALLMGCVGVVALYLQELKQMKRDMLG